MTKESIASMVESHIISFIYLLLVFMAGIGLNITALYKAIRVSINIDNVVTWSVWYSEISNVNFYN